MSIRLRESISDGFVKIKGFLFLLAAVLMPAASMATHFQYGLISWQPVAGTTVQFTIQNSWRLSAYSTNLSRCIDPASPTLAPIPCTGDNGFAGLGDVIVEFQGFTQFDPGDNSGLIGSPLGPLLYLVTGVSPATDSLFGFAIDPSSLPAIDTSLSHTYPTAGDYIATIDSCCRTSRFDATNEHINNPDGGYRIETIVNAGSGNTSPTSVLPDIVLCAIEGLCQFFVPGADPDGTVSFRLSDSAEASSFGPFVHPGPPSALNSAAIDNVTGLYTWDTSGAALATSGRNTLYSTQVTVEDATSKVAVDFFIQLVEGDAVPPVIEPPAGSDPICGTTQVVTTGRTRSFDVFASDADIGDSVTLNVAGLPAGAIMTPPLPITGNPVQSTFSWMPTDAQIGTSIVNFNATSSSGGFTLCPVTLVVVDVLEVTIDIRPGDFPNSINLGSNGGVPVAILSSIDFDATTVDPSTVALAGAGARVKGNGLPQTSIEDVNSDGLLDIIVFVDVNGFELTSGDMAAELTGETFDGQRIAGTDSIRIVGNN